MVQVREFPLGAEVTLEQLDRDPHPLLARLRAREPVSWLPVLDGWLVTRHDLALEVMRDAGRFTVDDPRFSTAQVIGASMLSLDGAGHARHRAPFVAPFRPAQVRARFAAATAQQAERLLDELTRGGGGEPARGECGELAGGERGALARRGGGELRRSFAGPLAASIVCRALGMADGEVTSVLGWYDAIVGAVSEITAGNGIGEEGVQAFAALQARLHGVIDGGQRSSLLAAAAADSLLTREQIVSNAAVLLFGGIETTEGMIANALLHLLARPERLASVRAEPHLIDAAIEESLRLEPAAAVVDRYATADAELGGTPIAAGDLVRVSITAANRDPAAFPDPDRFDLTDGRARGHLAFAQGPHVCVGVHLARLEARVALGALIARLPGLRLDPERPSIIRGLVFRKPLTLHVLWR